MIPFAKHTHNYMRNKYCMQKYTTTKMSQNNITAILYSTVVLTRGPRLLRATLDVQRVGCLCVAIIFASDGTKTQIVIYPNN